MKERLRINTPEILLILTIAVLLRVPSLFEPYWYLDESMYLAIGRELQAGSVLYSEVYDNKPPLIYLLASLFGGSLFYFKLFLMLWNLLTVLAFFTLAKVLLKNRSAVFISSLMFALLTSLPLLEGNLVNAELLFLLPILLAFNLLFTSSRHDTSVNLKKCVLAGLLFGIAFLFKVPAAFDMVAVLVILAFWKGFKAAKEIGVVGLAFLIPFAVSVIYFSYQGVTFDYINAAFLQNLSYVKSYSPPNLLGFETLTGRAVILVTAVYVLFLVKNIFARKGIFIFTWFIFSLFGALLSGRPYTHYLIQVVPALCLVCGIGILHLKREGILSFVSLSIFIITFMAFDFIKYPVTDYYRNFISYARGIKGRESYYSWFGENVYASYKISELLKKEGADKEIFVFGDEPSVYAQGSSLSISRFVTWFQIDELKQKEETLAVLNSAAPYYIVTFREKSHFEGLEKFLSSNYLKEASIEGVDVFRIKSTALSESKESRP